MDPIDNNVNLKSTRSGAEARTGAVEGAGRSRAAAAGTPVAEADAVTITRRATEMFELESQLAALPDADLERVEAIREAISNGSYKVDVERLVNSLLETEGDLS